MGGPILRDGEVLALQELPRKVPNRIGCAESGSKHSEKARLLHPVGADTRRPFGAVPDSERELSAADWGLVTVAELGDARRSASNGNNAREGLVGRRGCRGDYKNAAVAVVAVAKYLSRVNVDYELPDRKDAACP